MMPWVRRLDVCAGNQALDGSETEPVNSIFPRNLFNSVTRKHPFFLHPFENLFWFPSKGLFVCAFNLGVDKMISFHATWQLILGVYLLYRKLYFTLQIFRLLLRKLSTSGIMYHSTKCYATTLSHALFEPKKITESRNLASCTTLLAFPHYVPFRHPVRRFWPKVFIVSTLHWPKQEYWPSPSGGPPPPPWSLLPVSALFLPSCHQLLNILIM